MIVKKAPADDTLPEFLLIELNKKEVRKLIGWLVEDSAYADLRNDDIWVRISLLGDWNKQSEWDEKSD